MCDLFSLLTDCTTLQACPESEDLEERTTEVSVMETLQLHSQPNPFSTAVSIQFYLPANEEATLRILDTNGKQVYIQTAQFSEGWNTVDLNDTGTWAGGIYFYRIETQKQVVTKSMILLRN
ncbi:MAG: T9SS type A sorting domain-containing protein [Bacteroidota bacterium]